MVSAYPALTTQEFVEAGEALLLLCHEKLRGSSWRQITWTGDEFQVRQEHNSNTQVASDLEDDALNEDHVEGFDVVMISTV